MTPLNLLFLLGGLFSGFSLGFFVACMIASGRRVDDCRKCEYLKNFAPFKED
jgi:hypothetical protein